jgi:uncharacterized membrane protein YkvA (DUF1232 family)
VWGIAWWWVVLVALLAAYVAFLAALALAGRSDDARAWAGFVPDCLRLFGRLLRDPAVPRRHRVLLAASLLYLASPVDLVPDFIPVAGQLDDAILVGLVLRRVVRGVGEEAVRRHWPGPDGSVQLLLRYASSPKRMPWASGSSPE